MHNVVSMAGCTILCHVINTAQLKKRGYINKIVFLISTLRNSEPSRPKTNSDNVAGFPVSK